MSCQELSNAALVEIVERSAFLHERTGAGFLWAAEERCSAPQRIERWVQIAAKGDRKQFQQRLEWDGWTEEVAEKLAGGVRLRDRTHLPRWASLLRAAVDGRFCRRRRHQPWRTPMQPSATAPRSNCQ